ncbi:TFAP4 [Lepeophtheirus salmonis]|uniref:TFAP4 n=1 Tax=Lepeophtheirus salmonis TaxID=72036 RepID=A0A7R8HCZ9_LEPSM|nr:TFAP4 [Lepeophtheirus salmonis]CAF3024641.1 TFAP4 [Lepeophtheirus salmonis]
MLDEDMSLSRGDMMVTDRDKKVRREIANSNERRRMQSINAGFQGLRSLLPHHEGEKLSKASILQQTAEYIYSLEREKTRLLTQNVQLKRLLNLGNSPVVEDANASLKRRRENEADETALQLLRERQLRIELEAKLRTAESELASSRSALDKFSSLPPQKNHSSSSVKGKGLILSPRITLVKNLDSIVEAIRHLEGDHLFSSEDVAGTPNQVVKEEIIESGSVSPENKNTKSSSVFVSSSSSITSKPTPSPITLNVPKSNAGSWN